MFKKDTIAIDLGETNIKIMIGNEKVVKNFDILQTPEGTIKDGKIGSVEEIRSLIQNYLNSKNCKEKKVSFVISGQDIVSRHMEIPLMDHNGIMTSLEWEMNQYLPTGVSEYIIDYEIIEKIESTDKKVLKLLVVAAPIEKIKKIEGLCEVLNLKLESIDVGSNCINRVFKNKPIKEHINENIAVIDIGNSSTNIIILEKGKLFIEREIPFGLNNIVKEIMKKETNIKISEAFEYLEKKITLGSYEYSNELEKRILSLFDQVFSSLEKIVAFFTIGKNNSNIDEIYLIGEGCFIKGLSEYVGKYFKSTAYILEGIDNIGIKTIVPKDCDIKRYIGTLGLLNRKE